MPVNPLLNLAPPPPVNQGVDSRQFRDWFYQVFSSTNANLGQLGTMALQNANNVAITGGSIAGVKITGGTIDNTPIGQTTRAKGAFTDLVSSGTVSGVGFTNYFASPPPIGSTTPNTGQFTTLTSTGLGTFAGITITGAGDGITFVDGTKQTTAYIPGSIEAYDRSATITVTSTPTLLSPASYMNANGISYSAGIFTFNYTGPFALSLVVNANASAAGQSVYIYAESNTGSGWAVIPNSGKSYALPNAQHTQVVYSNAVTRTAGQQIRYWIYSNDSKVTLVTDTLPTISSTVYIPAIRIQYSG